MTIFSLLKMLHILSAIWMIAGVLGWQMARAQARCMDELQVFLSLAGLAGRFENRMARPGSLAVMLGWPIFGFLQGSSINWLLASNLLLVGIILVIVLVFIPRGQVYKRILQEAVSRGEIRPELEMSLDDPAVRWAHRYEEIATLAIIFLMVTKPF
jgi:hypothetical protein